MPVFRTKHVNKYRYDSINFELSLKLVEKNKSLRNKNVSFNKKKKNCTAHERTEGITNLNFILKCIFQYILSGHSENGILILGHPAEIFSVT